MSRCRNLLLGRSKAGLRGAGISPELRKKPFPLPIVTYVPYQPARWQSRREHAKITNKSPAKPISPFPETTLLAAPNSEPAFRSPLEIQLCVPSSSQSENEGVEGQPGWGLSSCSLLALRQREASLTPYGMCLSRALGPCNAQPRRQPPASREGANHHTEPAQGRGRSRIGQSRF